MKESARRGINSFLNQAGHNLMTEKDEVFYDAFLQKEHSDTGADCYFLECAFLIAQERVKYNPSEPLNINKFEALKTIHNCQFTLSNKKREMPHFFGIPRK